MCLMPSSSAVLTVTFVTLCFACTMKEFWQNDNKRLIGKVIQKTTNVQLHQCERMCKLYAECFAFNMRWSDKDRLEGDCEVLGSSLEEIVQGSYQSGAEYSYFGISPQTTIGSSYVIREKSLSWSDADVSCRNEDKTAHLVELQTEEKEAALRQSLPNANGSFWIGARRQDGGGPRDIIWTYSNVSVSTDRMKWIGSNPPMMGPCIFIYLSPDVFEWVDANCDWKHEFICEI